MNWFDGTIVDGIVNGTATMTKNVSRGSGLFDQRVVDGAVNGLADVTQACGRAFRHAQTGRIQHYLAGAAVGVLLVILLRMI